jgi:uncharacterized membrane protein YjgN (DUF898 family)
LELIQTSSSVLQTPPAPEYHDYPVRFTASGSEYFRIWIVNLLLILVTFGIYLPWAKVRKLRYFYGNTHVDGHALDFHGKGAQMLRGTAIVAVFLACYSAAVEVSGWAGLVAAMIFVAVWPMLFRASMRFRLANTSWHGLRFHFTGDERGAYAAMLPPLALGLLPVAILAAIVDPQASPKQAATVAQGVFGVTVLAGLALLPYLLWRIKRYQHENYAFGPVRSSLRCGPGSFYLVFLKMLGVLVLGGAVFAALILGLGLTGRGAGGRFTLMLALALAGVLFFNVFPRAFFMVQLQNLLWSRTGGRQFRFRSELALWPFVWLQLRNMLLIVVTLGLFWPFAVVATRRAQLEAVTLRTRIDLDDLAGVAVAEQDATGDAAADLFGMDVGL